MIGRGHGARGTGHGAWGRPGAGEHLALAGHARHLLPDGTSRVCPAPRSLPRAILALLLILGALNLAHAADLLDQVAARMQPVPVLRGAFTQERVLAGFSAPLRSGGSFIAARERGVLWSTEQPFPSLLIITADAIRERVDGEQSFEIDASREPALRQINQILLALLQGDLAGLRAQFSVTGEINDSWQLRLTPLAQVAELIGQIELHGNTQVESVTIHERNGDRSRVEFRDVRGDVSLTAEEAARFD